MDIERWVPTIQLNLALNIIINFIQQSVLVVAQPEYSYECETRILDLYCPLNGACHEKLKPPNKTQDDVMECLQLYFNCDCETGKLKTTTLPPNRAQPRNCHPFCKRKCRELKPAEQAKHVECGSQNSDCKCDDSPDSEWTTIAIVVSVIAGVIILAVVIFVLVKRRQRRKQEQAQVSPAPLDRANAPRFTVIHIPPPPPEEDAIMKESNMSLLGVRSKTRFRTLSNDNVHKKAIDKKLENKDPLPTTSSSTIFDTADETASEGGDKADKKLPKRGKELTATKSKTSMKSRKSVKSTKSKKSVKAKDATLSTEPSETQLA